MTVLFSDIRGFTTVTEKGNPEELVAQLNEYFSRMVEVVFRHQGTVDKFVGDMVMALFGAPVDDVDHAEHAVAAAVEHGARARGAEPEVGGRGHAGCSISASAINSGDMIAGNIGSSSIMSYTVIGDNVNLGARLESLNKDYKTRIIISDATRIRLKRPYDTPPARRRGRQGQDAAGGDFRGRRSVTYRGTNEDSTDMKTATFALRAAARGRRRPCAQFGGALGEVEQGRRPGAEGQE